MKRLIEEREPTLEALTKLVVSAQRHQPSPFAKRHVHSRLVRTLEARSPRFAWRPALAGAGALLIAATAAAAGYSIWEPPPRPMAPAPSPRVVPPKETPVASEPRPVPTPPLVETPPRSEKASERRAEKPRPAGEDPTQVAEAVRALRRQGDPVRAQALLDQYLRANPRGALAEDALALSIEAAAARKDPRAGDYARRYLARYPQGRFRAVAERALAK